jgi:hypothetical protein
MSQISYNLQHYYIFELNLLWRVEKLLNIIIQMYVLVALTYAITRSEGKWNTIFIINKSASYKMYDIDSIYCNLV